MSWQLLVGISVLTYSVSILLQRVLLKENKSDPIAYSIVFQIITGLIVGVFALFRGFSIPNLLPILPNLILMIFLYGVGNIFVFKALKNLEASDFTIIFASRTLWTIIAAIIFLKERADLFKKLIGSVISFIGVILLR